MVCVYATQILLRHNYVDLKSKNTIIISKLNINILSKDNRPPSFF